MITCDYRTQFRLRPTNGALHAEAGHAEQPGSLAHTVRSAADGVDRAIIRPVCGEAINGESEPRLLLAMVTYCYARQTYGSSAIAGLMTRDLCFRQLCGNELPDACLLRRFCRANRDAIQVCLTTALRLLARQKMAEGAVTKVSEPQLAEEARRRMVMATFVDSTEQDEAREADASPDLLCCASSPNGAE